MGQQKLDWMTTIIRRIRIFRMTKTWQPFLELLSMKIMRTWKSWKCLEIAWPHFYIIQCIYIYISYIYYVYIYIYIISNIFCIGVPFRLSIIYIYIIESLLILYQIYELCIHYITCILWSTNTYTFHYLQAGSSPALPGGKYGSRVGRVSSTGWRWIEISWHDRKLEAKIQTLSVQGTDRATSVLWKRKWIWRDDHRSHLSHFKIAFAQLSLSWRDLENR